MPSSDAILIGEDWISEHFFTTDATSQSFHARVLARRKDWDTAETPTARSRFTEARGDLEKALAELSSPNGTADTASHIEDARGVYDRLRQVLGYDDAGYHTHRAGPVLHVSAPGITAGAPLVLIEATPVVAIDDLLEKDAPTLLEPHHPDETTTLTSVPRLLSFLFVAEDGPDFALVLAGRWLLVAEKARWAEGRYLALDLQLVCERNETKRGGETDRALTCIAADSLAPDADGGIWWAQTLEESVKHTVGVSQDLREGVRLSIEIIANEVVTRRRDEGLPPLPADQAQPLAKQSLRFLYRILFLLYAEASPELAVLPVGASEYEQGYSLDRLRELTLVELTGPHARTGTHLYDSLALLFRLVDAGHAPQVDGDGDTQGLTFQPLRADLFRPAATALIEEVRLGNVALQRVLRHLLLSKETGGRDRGFISYAELGINQLGAVYEGLMSYTGFFATDDLYEVAKNGDSTKGSWVVPVDRATGISTSDFVTTTDEYTGERKPVLHEAGNFVFRLAGRERQQSASYYTPEVLTRFTVSQALEELLDQDGTTTTAEDILHLTVCEPALGSGAFAIEAVRQLAEQYLRRRQEETGQRIDPDDYPRELQRVKAYLALHQVYGVDLNATAVELAEISLWLDTMAADLDAPWFGLHLRRGNSLIGARHATYSRAQVADKSWLTATPTDHPLIELAADMEAGVRTSTTGAIHHFLLPAAGWGSAVEAKEARALAPDATAALKSWSRTTAAKPTATQLKTLLDLADRVEVLWQFALRRLQIAEYEARRDIPVWGHDPEPSGRAVTREEIEESLADVNGAYQRLRRVMDAWAALWFWPLTETETKPPTLAQWLDALQQLLGRDTTQAKAHGKRSYEGMDQLGAHLDWDALNDAEKLDIGFADAKPVATVLDTHPWLTVCERVATQQVFFHWELDFATVFARGGFDLQLGNPPWVRPTVDVDLLLAEGDPWWQLAMKPSEEERHARRTETLRTPGILHLVLEGVSAVTSVSEFISSSSNYPALEGLQPDLYRSFMARTWTNLSEQGVIGLIHPEGHLTEDNAGLVRASCYRRLRRHWHFLNELRLFEEVDNHVQFGVHLYGFPHEHVDFSMASFLYHPATVERSIHHDGSGVEPGLKDENGVWDVRPHRSRIQRVDEEVLGTWHAVLEDDAVPTLHTKMLYTASQQVARVIEVFSRGDRIASLDLPYSSGWHEKGDRVKGRFKLEWGPSHKWEDVILQGPHIFVSTPLYKFPNPSLRSNKDWSDIDFETITPQRVPVTAYKPCGDRIRYDQAFTDWGSVGSRDPARNHYRIAWRNMASNTGERTLIPAIIPPGAAHIHTVSAKGSSPDRLHEMTLVTGALSSLLYDFAVRAASKGTISGLTVDRLPMVPRGVLRSELMLRTLRLNCLTDAYAPLWARVFEPALRVASWAGGRPRENRPVLEDVGPEWSPSTPLRIAEDRRQALVEIDALVALMLGVTPEELCTVYRTQFAVLYGYDHRSYMYDMNGRLVPTEVLQVWRRKGDGMTVEERTATNDAGNTYVYELPFQLLNREADMRQAYTHFERILAERGIRRE